MTSSPFTVKNFKLDSAAVMFQDGSSTAIDPGQVLQ